MKIAVLSVQGAFAEHIDKLRKLGADCAELRQASDLEQGFDGLILPGGESTVQGKLLRELHMFEPLQNKIKEGIPVLGTCAGLILLAQGISNDDHTYFGTLPVCVRRNAYGRQLGSFHTEQEMAGIGRVPMTFIRAPYIEEVFTDENGHTMAEVLAEVNGKIVAVRYGNQIGTAFHPELDEDDRIHEKFLSMAAVYRQARH